MNNPESSPGPLRCVLIGAGRIAHDYLAAAGDSDALQISAVVDLDAETRERVAESTGLPVVASIRDALATTDIHAGLVLTPPSTHDELTLELLEAGLHVLCEKPIALTSAAASRMHEVAAQRARVLMMASKFRYVAAVLEARQLIDDGVIGEPVGFRNQFCSRVAMDGRWNADPIFSGGGVLIDHGTHSVDLARFLVGPIVKVLAHYGRRVQGIPVEDSVRVLFETMRGCTGLIDLSWSHGFGDPNGSGYYVELTGTRGEIQIGWQSSRYRVVEATDSTETGEWVEFGPRYDKRRAFRAQLENFAAAIAHTESPRIRADDAVDSARAIEAAYRSARVARWVPLVGS